MEKGRTGRDVVIVIELLIIIFVLLGRVALGIALGVERGGRVKSLRRIALVRLPAVFHIHLHLHLLPFYLIKRLSLLGKRAFAVLCLEILLNHVIDIKFFALVSTTLWQLLHL